MTSSVYSFLRLLMIIIVQETKELLIHVLMSIVEL